MYRIISLLMIVIFSLLCGLLFGDESDYFKPENILKFADYLYQDGDYLRSAGEYQRYLFYSPKNANSLIYKIGLCYRRAGDTEKAISFFQKINENNLHFDASYQIAYSYFITGQYDASIQSLDNTLNKINNPDEVDRLQVLKAFNFAYKRQWKETERLLTPLNSEDENLKNLAFRLKTILKEVENLPRKNPALAAFFSTIMPGSGKIYCKEYGDGIYSLIIIGITAYSAFSGFHENGINSIRGWLFGGMSMTFYIGNIYGSIMSAKIYNNQLETGILKNLPSLPD